MRWGGKKQGGLCLLLCDGCSPRVSTRGTQKVRVQRGWRKDYLSEWAKGGTVIPREEYLAAVRAHFEAIHESHERAESVADFVAPRIEKAKQYYTSWRANYDWWQTNYPHTRPIHRQTVCDAYEDVGAPRESVAREIVQEATTESA